MKVKNLILFLLVFLQIFDLTQEDIHSTLNSELSILNITELIKEMTKPSKAFTAVLMVYMCLIIIGAILVLIFIKPKIEN